MYRLGADNFINVYNGRRSEVEGRGGHGHRPLRRMAQRAASLKFKVACLCAMPVLRLSFPVIKILNLIYEIYTRAWVTSACPTSTCAAQSRVSHALCRGRTADPGQRWRQGRLFAGVARQ